MHNPARSAAAVDGYLFPVLILLLACTSSTAGPTPAPPAPPTHIAWKVLLPGLEFAEVPLPVLSHAGDSLARIVRVTSGPWTIALRTAVGHGGQARTVEGWLGDAAVAAINPGMFGVDWVLPTGHMVADAQVVNPAWSADRSVLAASGAGFHVFNLECEARPDVETYPTMVQSIRMLDCAGKNIWADQPREWSAALVGEDRAGRLLLIHVRSPYRMHDLVDQLIAMPLDLRALHYGDGGPPAFLSVRTPVLTGDWVGSWETGAFENDGNETAGSIPNVLVVVPSFQY